VCQLSVPRTSASCSATGVTQSTAKSAITHWTENIKTSSVLKIDIPSVIDENKTKTNMSANGKLTNHHYF